MVSIEIKTFSQILQRYVTTTERSSNSCASINHQIAQIVNTEMTAKYKHRYIDKKQVFNKTILCLNEGVFRSSQNSYIWQTTKRISRINPAGLCMDNLTTCCGNG